MSSFRSFLASSKSIIFDGATGTELQKRGLGAGQSPELFCLANPEILTKLHQDYILAGAQVLTTNTFGGTRFKLSVNKSVYEFNKTMVEIAKQASKSTSQKVFLAGSMGPTGQFLQPMGELSFEALFEAYQEQVQGLLAGGVDLFIVETQYDIAEARVAAMAVRSLSTLPIIVSMTYEGGVTLTGSDVATSLYTLANMPIDAIGINCSTGPKEMSSLVDFLVEHSPLPVVVQANAGLPLLVDGKTTFPLSPEDFSEYCREFIQKGVQIVGGCCGTSPAHIQALRSVADSLDASFVRPKFKGAFVSSRSSCVHIGLDSSHKIIGERINPTGKKKLTASLQNHELHVALELAEQQVDAGAHILDVNVGAPLVDEALILPSLVGQLCSLYSLPLSLDSTNTQAISNSLKIYPASPLVNSISGEHGRLESLGPLCRDFGAPFILLPLQGSKLPEKARERIELVEKLLVTMESLHIPKHLAVVDILALSIASTPSAAKECLEFIRYCRDTLELPTVCGLSNISFGLPAREMLNANFLAYAAGAGLSASILNPSTTRIAESLKAINLFQENDLGAESFIESYSTWKSAGADNASSSQSLGVVGANSSDSLHEQLATMLIKGDKQQTLELVKRSLSEGDEAFFIVNKILIPAITEVGAKYERREYFLPQLIRSAEAMKTAFSLLLPLLATDARVEKKDVIVIATVEGDIHDIGKNIVHLMLSNHGFEVIDLGKDVPAKKIVEAAKEHNAALIGLSALMTTTMVRMEDTVKLLREEGLPQKVMVGGAVLSDAYAESIGAYFSADAVAAVKLAQRLLGKSVATE